MKFKDSRNNLFWLCSETFHAGLKALKDYLTSIKNPSSDFTPKRLLEIMDSFSQPLYTHLASEPQAILALSSFESPERQFDLVKIEQEEGKKAITLDFAFNVLPIFMNNMESVEFEGGMWQNHPNVPAPVRWIMKNLIPMCKSVSICLGFAVQRQFPKDSWRCSPHILNVCINSLTSFYWTGHSRQWRFMACTSDGRRKQMVA